MNINFTRPQALQQMGKHTRIKKNFGFEEQTVKAERCTIHTRAHEICSQQLKSFVYQMKLWLRVCVDIIVLSLWLLPSNF